MLRPLLFMILAVSGRTSPPPLGDGDSSYEIAARKHGRYSDEALLALDDLFDNVQQPNSREYREAGLGALLRGARAAGAGEASAASEFARCRQSLHAILGSERQDLTETDGELDFARRMRQACHTLRVAHGRLHGRTGGSPNNIGIGEAKAEAGGEDAAAAAAAALWRDGMAHVRGAFATYEWNDESFELMKAMYYKILPDLDAFLNGRRKRKPEVGQYVHGLATTGAFASSTVLAARELETEAAQATIAEEARGALRQQMLRSVGSNTGDIDATLVDGGVWDDVSISHSGIRNETMCAGPFKGVCALLDKLPECETDIYGHVLVSRLAPGTSVVLHTGATNAQLTLHVGINVPPPSADGAAGRLIIDPAPDHPRGATRPGADAELQERDGITGGEPPGQGDNRTTGVPLNVTLGWAEGKVIAFDDSLPHRVELPASAASDRVVLLLRCWHPEVSLEERRASLHENPFNAPHDVLKKHLKRLEGDAAQARWLRALDLFRGGDGKGVREDVGKGDQASDHVVGEEEEEDRDDVREDEDDEDGGGRDEL